jgi:hypothetical protein
MADPTTIAAGAILKLAFDEFIKSSAGEAAKKLTGEALEKATDLRKTIYSYFVEKNNQRAINAFSAVETQGSETDLIKLEEHVDIAMEDNRLFAHNLRLLVQKIEALQPMNTQIMVDGFEGDNLEVNGAEQEIFGSRGKSEQIGAKSITAKTVCLTNIKQKIS